MGTTKSTGRVYKKKRETFDQVKVKFFNKIHVILDSIDGCWIWKGYTLKNGYGMHFIDGKWIYAHRLSWNLQNGEIPKDKELDHLCRIRNCVNPDHLEIVSSRENSRRGLAGFDYGLKQLSKTHCSRGHPYSGNNLHIMKSGKRECRKCRYLRKKQCRRKQRQIEVFLN